MQRMSFSCNAHVYRLLYSMCTHCVAFYSLLSNLVKNSSSSEGFRAKIHGLMDLAVTCCSMKRFDEVRFDALQMLL